MRNLTRRRFVQMFAAATTASGSIGAGDRLAESAEIQQPESLQSEFLANLTVEAQSPHQVGAAGSGRLVVPVSGGTFDGPRVRGTVIGPSGDWILERSDGSRVLDVRLMLQTDDAEAIYVSWRGIAYTLPDQRLFARILPMFETRSTKYAWLNNVTSVGVYSGVQGKIAYRIYQIL